MHQEVVNIFAREFFVMTLDTPKGIPKLFLLSGTYGFVWKVSGRVRE